MSRRLLSKPSLQHSTDSICQQAELHRVSTEHLAELLEGESKEAIHATIVSLSAHVGEAKTCPTAEIVATWKQIEDTNAPTTPPAVDHPWAGKPPAFAAEIAPGRRQPDGFIDHGWWTKKGTGDFLAEVNNHFSLAALKQSKGDNPNLLPGPIGPLAGTPNAWFSAENAGAHEITNTQPITLLDRHLGPWSAPHRMNSFPKSSDNSEGELVHEKSRIRVERAYSVARNS